MPRKRTPGLATAHAGASGNSHNIACWQIEHGDADAYGIGNQAILRRRCLGLICSVQCPGSVVIKTFDAVRALRDAGVTVAGGFHSPIEKECLDFLLRGEQPVIIVTAKGIARPRLPKSWQASINEGRLLILSSFASDVCRITKVNVHTRNEFVAGLTAAVLIPHASLGGTAETVARSIIERGKPLFTFDDEENNGLLQLGARPFSLDAIKMFLTTSRAGEAKTQGDSYR